MGGREWRGSCRGWRLGVAAGVGVGSCRPVLVGGRLLLLLLLLLLFWAPPATLACGQGAACRQAGLGLGACRGCIRWWLRSWGLHG